MRGLTIEDYDMWRKSDFDVVLESVCEASPDFPACEAGFLAGVVVKNEMLRNLIIPAARNPHTKNFAGQVEQFIEDSYEFVRRRENNV